MAPATGIFIDSATLIDSIAPSHTHTHTPLHEQPTICGDPKIFRHVGLPAKQVDQIIQVDFRQAGNRFRVKLKRKKVHCGKSEREGEREREREREGCIPSHSERRMDRFDSVRSNRALLSSTLCQLDTFTFSNVLTLELR